MFILGGLSLVIKLYSMTGLFWLKVAAAAYLSSFVIIEFITYFLSRIKKTTGRQEAPRHVTIVEEYLGLKQLLRAFTTFSTSSLLA